MDELFAWNWRVYPGAREFFWFERDSNGIFGYRMSHHPDHFERWSEEEARKAIHQFSKDSSRIPVTGPYLSEIPPVIAKIRLMEQRHKRYVERKSHA